MTKVQRQKLLAALENYKQMRAAVAKKLARLDKTIAVIEAELAADDGPNDR